MPYNGYTNWETWNVALWLNNDEGLYRAYRNMVCDDPLSPDDAERIVMDLLPDGTPDFGDTDGGYGAVNWGEVADAMMGD